jgi:hypothetical protein
MNTTRVPRRRRTSIARRPGRNAGSHRRDNRTEREYLARLLWQSRAKMSPPPPPAPFSLHKASHDHRSIVLHRRPAGKYAGAIMWQGQVRSIMRHFACFAYSVPETGFEFAAKAWMNVCPAGGPSRARACARSRGSVDADLRAMVAAFASRGVSCMSCK